MHTSSAIRVRPPMTNVNSIPLPLVALKIGLISSTGPVQMPMMSSMYLVMYNKLGGGLSIRYLVLLYMKQFARNTEIEHPIAVP
ncbi:MAG: hypothetical protein ACK518_02770 [bacterium]